MYLFKLGNPLIEDISENPNLSFQSSATCDYTCQSTGGCSVRIQSQVRFLFYWEHSQLWETARCIKFNSAVETANVINGNAIIRSL
jgi:hypothetical protein